MRACMHTHTYAHTFMQTYAHTYIHPDIHTYTHIHTHTYAYAYTYTFTYTYTYTHKHTSCTYPLRGAGRQLSWLPVLHRGYTDDVLAHASAPKIRVLA